MPRTIRGFSLLLTVAVLVLASGCGAEKPPLRVGLLIWPAYELPYLAQARGLLDTRSIQLVEFNSPAEVLRAYNSGGLDAIAVTIDYLLQISASDPQQRAIMAINYSRGADGLLGNAETNSLQALRGKRVGIERSVLGGFMLKRALEHAGLTQADVSIVSVDVQDSVIAFEQARVDAVVTYEPYRSQILAQGGHELFSSRDIPGEIIDVLITRRQTLERYETELAALIEGWLAALAELEQNPLPAAQIMASRENVSAEDFLASLDGIQLLDAAENRRLLTGPAPAMRRQFAVLGELMDIASAPDFDSIIDGRFFAETPP